MIMRLEYLNDEYIASIKIAYLVGGVLPPMKTLV